MKKTTLLIFLFVLIAIPFANADSIMPGEHSVVINNQITNINDFPDYVFVSICKLGDRYGEVKVIGTDGKIGDYYKFCNVNIYVISKSNFKDVKDMEYNFDKISNESRYNFDEYGSSDFNDTYYEEKTNEYFNSMNAKIAVTGIYSSKTVSDADPAQKIDNYYTIDLNQMKTKPDKIEIAEKGYPLYVYIILSAAALFIIIYIIFRKRK